MPTQTIPHSTMNGPYAQARRIKDIGLVLPKYYGKNGNTGRRRDSSAVYAHHHLSKGVSDYRDDFTNRGIAFRTTQQSQLADPAPEVSASLARGGKPVSRRSFAHQRLMQDIPCGIYVRVFLHPASGAVVSLALPVFSRYHSAAGASLRCELRVNHHQLTTGPTLPCTQAVIV